MLRFSHALAALMALAALSFLSLASTSSDSGIGRSGSGSGSLGSGAVRGIGSDSHGRRAQEVEANATNWTLDDEGARRLALACPPGFHDISGGNPNHWKCGCDRGCWGCYTTNSCNCACAPSPTTTTTTTTVLCPAGYTQLGSHGDDVPGWGTLTPERNSAADIDDCKYQCGFHSHQECAGFEYTGDFNGEGFNACTLYQIHEVRTALQTSHVAGMITCTMDDACHNLAIPLTTTYVTTVSGCNSVTDHNTLRTGDCTSTEWSISVPRCMTSGPTGKLIFDFKSDESSARHTSDKFEVFVDGVKKATWYNDDCNNPLCVEMVTWSAGPVRRSLVIKSTTLEPVHHLHASIAALRFEQMPE